MQESNLPKRVCNPRPKPIGQLPLFVLTKGIEPLTDGSKPTVLPLNYMVIKSTSLRNRTLSMRGFGDLLLP